MKTNPMAKVLIVDYSPTHVYMLKNLIEDWGYTTLVAENGDLALELARTEKPNVILMDIIMPGMSGFQITRKLTNDSDTNNIPIIFVSKKDGEADRVWGMRQGAIAFLTKPINPDILQTAISDAVAA